MEKKKSEELISCIEMFEDPGPTADFNREPAIPESASVDIKVAASVDFQSSESIDNKPSELDDSQSSESIDTKPSTSVNTLRLSEQPETEKSKSGVRTKNRKKKKKRNVDANFLPLVPLQCQEGSLEYRVRCRGGSEPFTKRERVDERTVIRPGPEQRDTTLLDRCSAYTDKEEEPLPRVKFGGKSLDHRHVVPRGQPVIIRLQKQAAA
ncbi:hypothetical protein F2Q68_00021159 [Brassica cretica]|uniref:Uncharacterized protein n=1 Tax=Brassica cretica TaxID=69181 RepID=A0A8S9FXG6_BRACR|nr:hypothetical protein F2Q68_00021159 [Brassica cretica]